MAKKSATTTTKSKAKTAKSSKKVLETETVEEMANRLNPNSPYYEHERIKSPHFAIFLGAGASVESGVHSANQMISDFIKRICAVKCPKIKKDGEKDKWLKDNKYYKSDKDKYGSLFEKCFPTEVDRREYIETQVDGKVPSLGYIALAHLIKAKIADTIITTNFDDLIYVACTSYTDIRPVVYSLGGFASEISGTTNRPRVLKLHGDFLFSNLINTESDEKKRELNMSQQVQQILEAYRGIIVIGYNGSDNSIIDLLSKIPDGKYFYWCVYKDEKVNEEVENLIKKKKGWIVRTEGFDKLFDEIRKVVGIKDDDIFSLFDERRQKIEEELKKFNPDEYAKFDEAVKYFNEGYDLKLAGKLEEAEAAYKKAIEVNPNYHAAYNNLGNVLKKDPSRYKEAEEAYHKAIAINPRYAYAYNNLGNLLEEDSSRYKEAEEAYRKAIELNPEYGAPYGNLAILLEKDPERYNEAEEAYRKGTELSPDDEKNYDNFADFLEKKKSDLKEAEKYYQKALEINPDYDRAKNNLANLRKKMKKK